MSIYIIIDDDHRVSLMDFPLSLHTYLLQHFLDLQVYLDTTSLFHSLRWKYFCWEIKAP